MAERRSRRCTGFSSQGRAKLRAFLRYCTAKNTQLSLSLTRKPCRDSPTYPHTLTHVFLVPTLPAEVGNGLSLIDFGAAAETGACFVSPPAKHLFPDVQKGAELHNLRACTVFPSPLRNLGFREPTFQDQNTAQSLNDTLFLSNGSSRCYWPTSSLRFTMVHSKIVEMTDRLTLLCSVLIFSRVVWFSGASETRVIA